MTMYTYVQNDFIIKSMRRTKTFDFDVEFPSDIILLHLEQS